MSNSNLYSCMIMSSDFFAIAPMYSVRMDKTVLKTFTCEIAAHSYAGVENYANQIPIRSWKCFQLDWSPVYQVLNVKCQPLYIVNNTSLAVNHRIASPKSSWGPLICLKELFIHVVNPKRILPPSVHFFNASGQLCNRKQYYFHLSGVMDGVS